MPHSFDRTHLTRPAVTMLSLLVGLPMIAQAQRSATLQVQATVLSAEGTLAWQSVARRLEAAADSGARGTASTPDLLATITDMATGPDGTALPARRTITVEFLSN
ncbi:MAG TPA: hypothetical protein VMJ30_10065 [Gemmatimonadales bacterium]|nr:hypothetical protein [Gemmatimonadales bacterium]